MVLTIGTGLAMCGMLQRSTLIATLLFGLVATASALCPNGVIEPPETCDDGNLIPGDGCSPLCLVEVPNLPPVCDGAFASPDGLWPPNHKLVPIGIDGVVDPDDDLIAITVTAVAQDEPVDAEGDGSTCGDADGLGTDVVFLRSERSGPGDGRVYHVAFRADDPAGGFCTGEVEVCVRHDNGHGGFCGDQGPLFDSTPAVCAEHDDCDLDECVPPPPVAIGDCDDVSLPPVIERRLNRTRRLLTRAAAARPARQRRLARLARLRLARLDALVARRLGGDCEIEVHDLVERASRCAFCPFDDDPSDDLPDHDDDGHRDDD
jgi:cysteine-rich repeat protein